MKTIHRPFPMLTLADQRRLLSIMRKANVAIPASITDPVLRLDYVYNRAAIPWRETKYAEYLAIVESYPDDREKQEAASAADNRCGEYICKIWNAVRESPATTIEALVLQVNLLRAYARECVLAEHDFTGIVGTLENLQRRHQSPFAKAA